MKSAIVLLFVLIEVGAAPNANPAPSENPPLASAASRKHDAALRKAAEDYHRAIIAADREYIADLDSALDAAFKRKDVDSVQQTTLEKKRVQAEIKDLLALLPARHEVDLLRCVVTKRDAVAGTWQFKDGVLIGSGGPCTRVRLPYIPPPEYDFKIEFARLAGSGSIQQLLMAAGHGFLSQVGAYDGRNCGFALVNGRSSDTNPSGKNIELIKNGEKHTCIVSVRTDRVSLYFDGQLVSQHQSNGFDLTMPSGWELGAPDLGIGTYQSSVAFYTIDVIEVTGTGKVHE